MIASYIAVKQVLEQGLKDIFTNQYPPVHKDLRNKVKGLTKMVLLEFMDLFLDNISSHF